MSLSASSSTLDLSLDDLVDQSVARHRSHPRLDAHGAEVLLTPRAVSDAALGAAATRFSSARAEPYDRRSAPGAEGGVERGGGHGRRRTRASAGRQTGEAAEGYGEHMASADVASVASSRNPLLKVSSESKPNSVAGAICNVVRESAGNEPPAVMATGPAAINQAMKSVAIARKYLLDEDVYLTRSTCWSCPSSSRMCVTAPAWCSS